MRKLLHTAVLASALALTAACEIPFELDNVSEPVLYVEYIPSAPMQASFRVAYADPAFGKLSGERYTVKASDVTILRNGESVGVFRRDDATDGNINYFNIYGKGLEFGDDIEFSVKGHGVPDVHARTVIPPAPKIESVSISKVEAEGEETRASRVKVTLADAVKDGEFYGIQILEKRFFVALSVYGTAPEDGGDDGNAEAQSEGEDDGGGDGEVRIQIDSTTSFYFVNAGQLATTADINKLDLDAFASVDFQGGLFGSQYGGAPMSLLSSRQFGGGKEYSFYVHSIDDFGFGGVEIGWDGTPRYPYYPQYPEEPEGDGEGEGDWDTPDYWDAYEQLLNYQVLVDETSYIIMVYRLSEELYNWCKAQYVSEYNILSNFGVTPPNFTYSNVRGGLGIVGGISGASTDWIPDPHNEEPLVPDISF